jgi:hypothetical protein
VSDGERSESDLEVKCAGAEWEDDREEESGIEMGVTVADNDAQSCERDIELEACTPTQPEDGADTVNDYVLASALQANANDEESWPPMEANANDEKS